LCPHTEHTLLPAEPDPCTALNAAAPELAIQPRVDGVGPALQPSDDERSQHDADDPAGGSVRKRLPLWAARRSVSWSLLGDRGGSVRVCGPGARLLVTDLMLVG
jgi:hypothetical protein